MTMIRRHGAAVLTLAALLLGPAAFAQQTTITPNYKEADIRQIVEAVSAVTDRNFIIDPRVNAKVTMLSKTPLSAGVRLNPGRRRVTFVGGASAGSKADGLIV